MTFPQDPGTDHQPAPPSGNRRRDARLVITGVLLALGVWFALANTQDVKIRFWFVDTKTPVVSALAVAAVIGAGLGLLVARRFRRPT